MGPAASRRPCRLTRPPGARPGRFPVLVWEVALRSWRRFFPARQGFQHLLWSDDNLTDCVREEFPQHLGGFLALPGGIERSDAGRYCVMHRHGGIYADLDYEARTEFFDELSPSLASLLECRSKDAGIDVENSLMSSPPGHALWRLAMARIFGAAGGTRRWDDPSSGTGPRMLTALLQGADARALGVHVLPCSVYQRSVAADSGEGHCGRVLDAYAAHQRGIHWSTTSHTSFVGAALRAEVFFAFHPELQGRPLFRGPSVHTVAAASQGADPSASRPEAERTLLRGACLEGARAAGAAAPTPAARHRLPVSRAEELLRSSLAAEPSAAHVRYLLGSALQAQGRGAEAMDEYCGALVLDPALAAARTAAEFVALGRAAGTAQQALGAAILGAGNRTGGAAGRPHGT